MTLLLFQAEETLTDTRQEARERMVGLHETLLGCIGRLVGVAEHAVTQAVDLALILPHQEAEARVIAL